ncbi:MAG: hypothetical protein JST00_00035 [Deltaproteobacteria bacterium]|nr:hypothetical protein [Deltaproteobacteria bacterium]
MKSLLLGSIVAVSLVIGGTAAAEAPATPAPAAATFSALPGGRVPVAPKGKAPVAIGAGERVPGFFVERQQGRADFVNLLGGAAQAKARSEGRGEHQAGDPCFTERTQSFGLGSSGDDEEEPQTWHQTLQPSLFMSASSQHGSKPTVTAVHSERIAESGPTVSLEISDAWVDPVTRGVRSIARSSMPLQLVATMFGGDRVFAARDGETVHVVLITKDQSRSRGLFAINDGRILNSACNHIRASMKAERGQGAAATFISQVELGPLDPSKDDEAKVDPKKDPFGALRRLRTEKRVRPIHIQSSLTWSSRDKEPILTVSAGWDAREQSGF